MVITSSRFSRTLATENHFARSPASTPAGDERTLPLDHDLAYLRFINPMDLRVVERTCGDCHEDLCNDLCNIAHQVRCYESAVTESGVVTAANLMEITVQCEEAGNPSRCDGGGGRPAGGGGGGDSSCPGLCAHLASECGSEYVRQDCVSHCRDEVVSGDLSDDCRTCCASARFSTNKCEDEGLFVPPHRCFPSRRSTSRTCGRMC